LGHGRWYRYLSCNQGGHCLSGLESLECWRWQGYQYDDLTDSCVEVWSCLEKVWHVKGKNGYGCIVCVLQMHEQAH
jgi:hypothetical protein